MADEATTDAATETSGDSATTETTETESTTQQDASTQTDEVRDPQKLLNAYEAEKQKRKENDQAVRELRAELDALKAKAEGKEAEHQAALEAQRVKDEAIEAANQRILKAELRAAAKGKIADEALADLPALMDLSGIEVGADGEVDPSQIASAIDDLISKKPYLAAQGQRIQGSADAGARNETGAAQLTEADVKRLYAERKYDEIEKARTEGRLKSVLGG
jgi:type I site-specific restriction endonuclease